MTRSMLVVGGGWCACSLGTRELRIGGHRRQQRLWYAVERRFLSAGLTTDRLSADIPKGESQS